MAEMQAQSYLDVLRAARRAARQPRAALSGNAAIRYAEAFQRVTPQVVERAVTDVYAELARLGTRDRPRSGRPRAVVDVPSTRSSRARVSPGPARTVRCGQDDNLMVHAAVAEAQPGEVLVLTMPEPGPVALVGELLATQAKGRGVAAVLVDAAVRDVEELRDLGLPIWARHVRVRGADKDASGHDRGAGRGRWRDDPPGRRRRVGRRRRGRRRAASVSRRCSRRPESEQTMNVTSAQSSRPGEFSYDLDGLRQLVES